MTLKYLFRTRPSFLFPFLGSKGDKSIEFVVKELGKATALSANGVIKVHIHAYRSSAYKIALFSCQALPRGKAVITTVIIGCFATFFNIWSGTTHYCIYANIINLLVAYVEWLGNYHARNLSCTEKMQRSFIRAYNFKAT